MLSSILSNPLLYALLSGILPALLWLWFWLREDNLHPEPRSRIALAFIGGMLAVPLVIPFQKIVYEIYGLSSTSIVWWALFEEVIKFAMAYFFALRTRFMDEPIDALIYLITVALGFAALENSLFILSPITEGDTLRSITLGNLRFIGATLLHVVSSASIGIFIAVTFYRSRILRYSLSFIGLAGATALHTYFNLFIMNSANDTLTTFSYVWAAVIVLMLIFEHVKSIKAPGALQLVEEKVNN